MVVRLRHCRPHFEYAHPRRIARLGYGLKQQRCLEFHRSPIPNRATRVPSQRCQISNLVGLCRVWRGPRPSPCHGAYPASVASACMYREQHGFGAQHANRKRLVAYPTMESKISSGTMGNGAARDLIARTFTTNSMPPFIVMQQRSTGFSPLIPFFRPSTLFVFQEPFPALLLK